MALHKRDNPSVDQQGNTGIVRFSRSIGEICTTVDAHARRLVCALVRKPKNSKTTGKLMDAGGSHRVYFQSNICLYDTNS